LKNVPLSPQQELTLLRQRYPSGLYCTNPEPCAHRLIASTSIGWSKSWADLPEAEREARRAAYVCAGCRLDASERRTRVAASKAQKAHAAGEAARARRLQKFAEEPTRTTLRTPRFGRLDLREKIEPAGGIFRDGRAEMAVSRPGRPKQHASAADRAREYGKVEVKRTMSEEQSTNWPAVDQRSK
jgi:hypothetical protein